jgi:hypothetical protein
LKLIFFLIGQIESPAKVNMRELLAMEFEMVHPFLHLNSKVFEWITELFRSVNSKDRVYRLKLYKECKI